MTRKGEERTEIVIKAKERIAFRESSRMERE